MGTWLSKGISQLFCRGIPEEYNYFLLTSKFASMLGYGAKNVQKDNTYIYIYVFAYMIDIFQLHVNC